MPAKYELIFQKLDESRVEDPSTFAVESIQPGYTNYEASEIDELRRVSMALQIPETRSFTTT